MTKNIIIKTSVQKRFDNFMVHGRVLFFSAPCGFGKTVLADALLRGRNVLRQSAADLDCAIPPSEQDWDILLIDDLQLMQEEAGQQALCELIRSSPERRFVLLSRGVPPGCLTAFQYTGLMTVLEADDLLFDAGDVRRLFQLSGVNVTDSEIDGILKESMGYPLGVAITARCMSPNKPWTPELVARVFHEVFLYFETAIYRRFDLPVRHFLLELAPFESFDLEMARMVSGDPRAGERLDWILRYTTMLRYEDCQRFHFWSGFRAFLLWEMEREYTEEKRKALFSRGGLYYELKEDYAHALECYTSSGDHSKVSELLVRNAELHPGMGHYAEMEKYYRSLPETEILASPSLMQGMSMLCALVMDYEGSERWYGELQKFVEHCGRQDAAGKQARGRLAWLDISLPQRGVKGLTETIPAVFRLLTNKEVALPSFSVTSALPSIMNGGKDFSEWSKKDDLLYKTLRLPVEAVLGRDGVCLADCAIAESKFEKGADVTRRMLSLLPQLNEVRNQGTPDMEFAVSGLLARSQMANGQPTDARRTIEVLRECFAERGLTRFLPNMDAMLCRIDMHTGDLDAADAWYREKAPCEPTHLNVMRRYQYLTQAMVEIMQNRPDAALLTLSPMEPYIQNCARIIDGIHLNVLTAITLHRKRDEQWRGRLTAALDAAAEYSFITTVSMYGTAVLPLLETLDWDGDKKWYKQIMAAVRMQAAFYPDFLAPRLAPGEELTPMELQILHLLCADKSNAEIAQIMDVKLPTVKTHVSHILDKLDVKRRAEARTAAKKLHLVQDDL
jgi:LuxR family maltose regulon positive regulatory protein